MNDDLIQAVRDKSAILFVGAGVSINLGLPSFSQLIQQLASELHYDPEIFSSQGDYLTLAEYFLIEKGTIGPLRSWLDRTWHEGRDIAKSEVHRLIVELGFPIIYTTNYDAFLERAYKHYGAPYVKIANVGDLIGLRPGATQIVKFHGDFEDDASIVLTESSYFERLNFETPLDIKLRSDLLGRSVLFIGYSISDVNIRYMLYRLQRLWESSAYAKARPKSYVFLAHPNPVQERILLNRNIVPIVSEFDEAAHGLEDFLKRLAHDALGYR